MFYRESMSEEEHDCATDKRAQEISRWQMRNLYREQAQLRVGPKADLVLSYSELSIGPVFSVSTQPSKIKDFTPFHTFDLPIVLATYIQHLLVWSLTLSGNKNLAETALYNNLKDSEKLSGAWPPHFSFLVNGEAAAIEAKVQIKRLLRVNRADLFRESIFFLRPIPNDPTKEQYVPPERQGKRGKYDPGPVFGSSIEFLHSEFEIQKFFDE